MRRGLIPNELARLERVRVFSPNVHAEWRAEEDERALIEWARREDAPELRPDELAYTIRSFISKLRALIP